MEDARRPCRCNALRRYRRPPLLPPSHTPARHFAITATAKPVPVRKIAAISEKMVNTTSYALGITGENASMAMNCVAQMPDIRSRWQKRRAKERAFGHLTGGRDEAS